MKNILLPTDFSDNAWSASVYALKLYANEECKFYFLNSTKFKDSETRSYITSKYIDTLKEEALQRLTELKRMARIANANANHEFDIILSDKKLKDAVNENVLLYDIELVVMGTKGATGAKEVFFGSNTVHIINTIKDCSILVVPDEYDFVIPKQIAFPTNFKHHYLNTELIALKNLAGLYNSKIRVLRIIRENEMSATQNFNYKILKEHLQDFDSSFHVMPDYTKKVTEINEFIKDLDIDLLAMVKYKHSFIEKIIREPVISKIGFNPTVPFLVIPE